MRKERSLTEEAIGINTLGLSGTVRGQRSERLNTSHPLDVDKLQTPGFCLNTRKLT